MEINKFSFNRTQHREFVKVLHQRVNGFFRTHNRTRYANAEMVIKSIVVLSMLFGPYFLMVLGVVTNVWLIFLCWIIMGFGTAAVGFSVMHDANHGAYSRNKTVNKIVGSIMYFIGGNPVNWQIQHNVLHHTFTNVDGMDEDIDAGKILRFSPKQEYYSFHRYQHIYAWFLYGLMTHMWITTKDFKQLKRYKDNGLLEKHGRTYRGAMTELILTKALYYVFILVIPLLVVNIAWYWTILFFLIMHFIEGLTLSLVFQTAHVMEHTEFPEPDVNTSKFENNWAIHQLQTTMNFAPKSRVFAWFIGGLNYQVEHHLFPNICHIHYPKLSKIVRETAQEFGLPYHVKPTFMGALVEHARMLRQLGRVPAHA